MNTPVGSQHVPQLIHTHHIHNSGVLRTYEALLLCLRYKSGADCAAALVKLLRRCVNQMTGKTRQYVDTSIKFEREASQQVWPDTAQLQGPLNSSGLMAESAFTGTMSHGRMRFCKRCIAQHASSPMLPASQAVLSGTDCLCRGTTHCLPHSEKCLCTG